MASRKNGTLYAGVTADIGRRVWEHRDKIYSGFTSKYNVTNFVWYREYDDIRDAITEEKRIKRWRREWKIQLIQKANPEWEDLYLQLG